MPKPSRTAAACLGLCIAVFLDQWKLLFPGQYTLLSSAESVRQAYSWFTYWQRSMLHGTWPLWDPNAWGGYAFPGEMQTAPFYPLYLILLLFRPNHFGLFSIPLYNALFVAAHLMAALFMFALMRQLRVSRFAAAVAGFAFSSGGFVGAVGWPHMLQSAIWLPCIILFFVRALESPERRSLIRNALFSGAFLGLSLLAGGLHIAIAQTIFVVAAGGYYAVVQGKSRCAVAACVVVAAGMGLAAVQLLPSHLYAQHSLRAMGGVGFPSDVKVPYTFLTHDGLSPRAIVSFLFPSFDGIGFGEVWTPYVGVLPFLFAILAATRLWQRLWVKFLVGIGIAAFLYSLAGASALHGVLYVVTPFLWMAREATRFIYLTGFCVCVLAAFGVDYFCTALQEAALWAAWKVGLGLAASACVLVFLLSVFVPKVGGYWEYFSLMLLLMSCALLYYAVTKAGFREGPMFRLLLFGILFFDLNAFNWTGANKLENGHNGTDDVDVLNSLKGTADYLKAQPSQFRVRVARDPEPNLGDAYGLQTLAGGGVTIDRHVWKVQTFYDLLNVLYTVRPASTSEPGAVYQDKDWKVYRNTNGFPRAWIVHRFQVDSDESSMLQDTKSRLAELRSIAFVAHNPNDLVSDVTAGSENETAHIDFYGDREIRLQVSASRPGLLVLSEMYYPEWHAAVNGREEKIIRADEALRAVPIPAGASSVRFTYRPDSVYLGTAVSVLSAAGMLAAILVRFRRPRRASTRP